MGKNIFDIIDTNDNDDVIDKETVEELSKLILPELCSECKNAPICSVLEALAQLSTINVELEIKKCPFYVKNQ